MRRQQRNCSYPIKNSTLIFNNIDGLVLAVERGKKCKHLSSATNTGMNSTNKTFDSTNTEKKTEQMRKRKENVDQDKKRVEL